MQDEHRKSIQKNFTSLVEQTDLDHMVSALYEKGVFSEQMIEPYKDTSKDARTRKRHLYIDITRRGPHAFENLLEALTEAGNWDLVRDLDPNNPLHLTPRLPPTSAKIGTSRSQKSSYVSISTEKHKAKNEKENNENIKLNLPRASVVPSEIPHFHIVKSTKFFEDNGDDLKLYRTRSRQRGVLLMFSYTEFSDETFRSGADVDCRNLKYLFDEFGFKVLGYNNLTQKETLHTLESLRQVQSLQTAECVFVVVSSHGHERAADSDVDVRCFDGSISVYQFIDYFSNINFPELKGKPKVFIFQICRGRKENRVSRLMDMDGGEGGKGGEGGEGGDGGEGGGGGGGRREADGAPRAPAAPDEDRLREYSDILIAYSTVPGYVSYRDREKGSWYIQTLCEVFAARAHERHVHDLLTLVDQRLELTFPGQTSSIDNWGFNRRLYLHPGLFDD